MRSSSPKSSFAALAQALSSLLLCSTALGQPVAQKEDPPTQAPTQSQPTMRGDALSTQHGRRHWTEPSPLFAWYDNAMIRVGLGMGRLHADFAGGMGEDISMSGFLLMGRLEIGIPITSEVILVGNGALAGSPGGPSIDIEDVTEDATADGARMDWTSGQVGLLWVRRADSELAVTFELSLGYASLAVANPLNGSYYREVEKQSVGMFGGSLGATLELAASERLRVGWRNGASLYRGTKHEETTALADRGRTYSTERDQTVVATLLEMNLILAWSL